MASQGLKVEFKISTKIVDIIEKGGLKSYFNTS